MYPYLFGNEHLPMYGILMASGAAVGILAALANNAVMVKRKLSSVPNIDIFFAALFAFVFGIIGAKLFSIIGNLKYVFSGELSIWDLMSSGFVFYGGFVGGALGILLYCKVFKMPVVEFVDRLAVGVPLGHAIGRMGCLCSGCCYGKPTDSAIGIVFTNPLDVSTPTGIRLVPTQIIEALALVLIFVLLIIVSYSIHKKGAVTFAYAVVYAVARFVIEFFRGDVRRVFNETLTGSQITSLVIVVAAVSALIAYKIYAVKRLKKKPD